MNYSTAIFLISDKARGILASYEKPPEGHAPSTTLYKTLDPKIRKGDYVVVPTNTRHHMTVCRVEEVDVEPDFDSSAEVSWIVGVVNRADFDELTRQEDEAIATIKSAEKERKRRELAASLLASTGDKLKSLPIYTASDESEQE